jgi:hypothetical protein
LTAAERISLLGDEWWMVRSARHDVDAYLDLATALASDDTAAITATLASRLSFIHDFIADAGDRARFEEWVRARFGPALTALGLPGEAKDDDERQTRRTTLLRLIGTTGNDGAVRDSARDLALKYIENPASLPPSMAAPVLEVAAQTGDANLYQRYMAQIEKLSGRPEEYYRYFHALAWFRDPALVRRTLEFVLTPAARSQDAGLLIAGLMARPEARDLTWAFVKAQWPALTRKLDPAEGLREVVSSTGNFCSLEAATDVRQFFTQNPPPGAARGFQQAIDRIESCEAVHKRQSAPLAKWLAMVR